MEKDFLSIWQLTADEIYQVFKLTDQLRGKDISYQPLRGKAVALLFEKRSTRTRVSFEVGAYQLGAHPVFLSTQDIHLGKNESLEDTARALSGYVDGVMIRTFEHKKVEKFALNATVPVINGLTDLLHPCQAMADYYTLWREKKPNRDIKIAYVGDGNNVCNSLILGAARLGVSMTVATPPEYRPCGLILQKIGKSGRISITEDPKQAAKQADVIYTDVWVSMGQEKEKEQRRAKFLPYQVNQKLLSLAKSDALVMHCLPAHRGEEITDQVIDGKNSVVWEQAENRLHVQKALMLKLMGPDLDI